MQVRGARGSIEGIQACRLPAGLGGAGLVTCARDGAVRVWRVGGGLLQTVEGVGVTGMAVCSEGVVTCGGNGAVRLYAFN